MTDAAASRLDRLISYLSPVRGARRLAARHAMQALAYEGARTGRREDGWVTGSTSANTENSASRETLKNRSNALQRDNPYATSGVVVLVANRIGTGIIASPDGPNRRVNAHVAERHKLWINRCDYNGRTDLYGIQALAERTRIVCGAALIRFVTLTRGVDDKDVPIRLQVLEPDYIDTTKNEHLAGGREVREGIEYTGGRATGYWLFDQHPGDSSPVLPFSRSSNRYPATDVIHYYRATRAGQLTGVTEFAPVIRRLYDLDGYADAELLRKKIAACLIGGVTTPGTPAFPGSAIGPTSTDAKGRKIETFAPGMYKYFAPGESVEFFDPKPSDGYHEFFSEELHAIAAGLGVPYELLTGDFSQVNYTSFRARQIQFRAAVESDQEQLTIPQLCLPIWDRFVLELGLDSEDAMPRTLPAKFTPPRFGLLDPAKEIPAQIQAIDGKLRSWSDTIRRDGYEPSEVLDEIEKERKEFARRGLPVTSGPQPEPDPAPTQKPDTDDDEDAAGKKAA